MSSRLLVLSNGHGEDLIALRVIRALLERRQDLMVSVLPLVGEGQVFEAAACLGELRILGPRRRLPSGGFSNQSLRGLLLDLMAGLPAQSWRQWRIVRRWGREGAPILAVGDLLPLLLAWASGAPYGFLGTPKSDYTWRSGPGARWPDDAYHRCKGSEWDPWEWALLRPGRCRLAAVRDPLTARGLRRHGVGALAPGNPMMDGFPEETLPTVLSGRRRVVLLCGSRQPEALANFERLLAALDQLQEPAPMLILCPTGSRPGPTELGARLAVHRYVPVEVPPGSGAGAAWRRGPLLILHGPGCFERWAGWAEVGLATAGTATEQLAGLGVPCLSLPGPGPQFKASFARRQSRLLGGAVRVCPDPVALAAMLEILLQDPVLRRSMGRRGRQRMGPPGGSSRLAALLERRLLPLPGG